MLAAPSIGSIFNLWYCADNAKRLAAVMFADLELGHYRPTNDRMH